MISEELAQKIVGEYQQALSNYKQNNSKENLKVLREKENVCLDKLSYLVRIKISKYKQFNNYEDLYQEGLLMLLHSMNNYNAAKGSFFWWSLKYIGTKIMRTANLHTTIKVPLKEARKHTPYKEVVLPTLIEEVDCPELKFRKKETRNLVQSSYDTLSDKQKNILNLLYGLDDNKPVPVYEICEKLSITRNDCLNNINNALSKMRREIKLK